MSSTAANKTVIVAGDDSAAISQIIRILEHLGCDTRSAASPEEAENKALRCQAICLIVDLDSKGVDWLQTAIELRSHKELSRLSLIAASADGGRGIELFSRIGELGLSGIEYLPLPASADELDFRIRRIRLARGQSI
ncbi:MAG TPA: hypothetical protein VMM38_01005 [Aridibacter sp.]|nr:hypothetical protein [Aridibacter sp.]